MKCKWRGGEIKIDSKGTWFHRDGYRVECPLKVNFLKARPAIVGSV